MKTSDHTVQELLRHLKDEAVSLRERAKRLETLATWTTEAIKDGPVTPHAFEFLAQEAIDVVTHRSNVHLQFIARSCTTLAAEAAVDWAKAVTK